MANKLGKLTLAAIASVSFCPDNNTSSFS